MSEAHLNEQFCLCDALFRCFFPCCFNNIKRKEKKQEEKEKQENLQRMSKQVKEFKEKQRLLDKQMQRINSFDGKQSKKDYPESIMQLADPIQTQTHHEQLPLISEETIDR